MISNIYLHSYSLSLSLSCSCIKHLTLPKTFGLNPLIFSTNIISNCLYKNEIQKILHTHNIFNKTDTKIVLWFEGIYHVQNKIFYNNLQQSLSLRQLCKLSSLIDLTNYRIYLAYLQLLIVEAFKFLTFNAKENHILDFYKDALTCYKDIGYNDDLYFNIQEIKFLHTCFFPEYINNFSKYIIIPYVPSELKEIIPFDYCINLNTML